MEKQEFRLSSKFSECILCDIIKGGVDITGKKPYILYQNESFIATVDLGSMVEGYVLITCKRHINSMGELTDREYIDFMEIQKKINIGLKQIYSKKCICFEHGSGNNNQDNAASSIKHAHFHMVAIDKLDDDIHEKIINDMEMLSIENQRELKNYVDEPYIYYMAGDGKKYISTKQGMESQYMRQRIAEQFRTQYNWKDPDICKSLNENVLKTEKKWKNYIEESKQVYCILHFIGFERDIRVNEF